MVSLAFVRRYLLFWTVVVGVFYVYLNWYLGWQPQENGTIVLDFSRELKHWWDVTHPAWISVPQTIVLIPLIFLFNLHVMRRFGGFGSHMGKAIFYLSAGVFIWGGIGNIIWFAYQITHDGATPAYPWWSDVAYVALLPLYFMGMYHLNKVMAISGADYLRKLWIPIGAFLVTAYLTVPMPGGGPKWVIDDWSAWSEKGTFGPFNWVHASVGYVASDIVILSMALVALFHVGRIAGGVFSTPVRLVVASLFLQYLGDIFFDQRYADGVYHTGDIATICYGTGMYLMMFAIYRFAQVEARLSEALNAGGAE